jgi:hypothetical protein
MALQETRSKDTQVPERRRVDVLERDDLVILWTETKVRTVSKKIQRVVSV